MTRRLRRRRRDDSDDAGGVKRFPTGLLFTILAVLVLLMILGYDRHEQNEAKDRADLAAELAANGQFSQAVAEYKAAMANARLSKKARAAIAVKIGHIYLDQFEDYDRALIYYSDAKRMWPASVNPQDVQNRMRLAQDRTRRGSGEIGSDTTTSLISRVELLSPPKEDGRGEVIAQFNGEELRAGEIDRLLKRLPDAEEQNIRSRPELLEAFVAKQLDRALVYRAAVDGDLHRSPDVSENLYEYQRTLLNERLESEHREKASVVTRNEVDEYYRKNREKYSTPAKMTLAMIKTSTRDQADSASEALRAGAAFRDAATTFSVHKQSAAIGGVVGTMTANDDAVPGVGTNPELAKQLLQLDADAITKVIEAGDAFYIFNVISKQPEYVRTVDDVRPQIESLLRNRKSQEVRRLAETLRERYHAKVDHTKVKTLLDAATRASYGASETTSTQPAEGARQ